MARFNFFQDELVQLWRRNYLSVEAETKEEAIAKLKERLDDDFSCNEDEDITQEDTEFLYDTESRVSPKEGVHIVEMIDSETYYTFAWK